MSQVPSSPAPASARERMRPVDVAWLRMDEPDNLMQINAVFTLEGPADLERIRALIAARLLKVARFRQRVVEDGGRLWWEEDPDLDVARHVVATPLPAPGDEAAAQRLFGEFMAEPLDHAHPLWMIHVVDGFEGGTALFARLHHAVGDGVGLMLVLLSLCDLDADGSAHDSHAAGRLADLFGGPAESMLAFRQLMDDVMPDTMRLLLTPVEALRRTNPLVKAAGIVWGLLKLVGYLPDPKTSLKGPLVRAKRAAWTRPLPLDEVKDVARGLGCTINDVLGATASGGLRRYLAREGALSESLVVRAAVPINLRPLEKMSELGNRFGLAFLGLPIGIADPRRRLAELKRRADRAKRSAEPLCVLGLLHAMGIVPPFLHRLVVRIFGAKATLVMTNVPGPRRTLYLAGRALLDMFFWVPESGHLGLGISIISYRGRVRLGFNSDAGLIPDPGALIDGFYAEWEAMRALARSGRPDPVSA